MCRSVRQRPAHRCGQWTSSGWRSPARPPLLRWVLAVVVQTDGFHTCSSGCCPTGFVRLGIGGLSVVAVASIPRQKPAFSFDAHPDEAYSSQVGSRPFTRMGAPELSTRNGEQGHVGPHSARRCRYVSVFRSGWQILSRSPTNSVADAPLVRSDRQSLSGGAKALRRKSRRSSSSSPSAKPAKEAPKPRPSRPRC